MQGMQALQLEVHRPELVADVATVIDPLQVEQHRLDLAFAVDQDAALGGSGLVGHDMLQ
jgi:hypothetical protein